ncbi:uncharacterized protein H6S33_005693 [Morchella sextelata]|uniref:uncharacterized protein n=1 Tax=Morchella sextelata TaxID=1174677 RepID=UPI001D05B054|nr:uncharacterized protein H6S33_005693 [Morchella sextelata]KAH0613807.1 hypothetical protein H6S33_005693 [Morchella sextelata]
MVSRVAEWKRRQRQLSKELATTEWRIENGGHVTQWPKDAPQESIDTIKETGEVAARAWRIHKTPCGPGEEHASMVCQFIADWPEGIGMRSAVGKVLKLKVLDAAIQDMNSLLESPKCPKGQDHRRHLQVLSFLNIQRMCLDGNKSRTKLSLSVANTYGKGVKLSESIMCRERDWVRCRFIEPGHQGKHQKFKKKVVNDPQGELLAGTQEMVVNEDGHAAQAKEVSV